VTFSFDAFAAVAGKPGIVLGINGRTEGAAFHLAASKARGDW
jgi:hypothetical protein